MTRGAIRAFTDIIPRSTRGGCTAITSCPLPARESVSRSAGDGIVIIRGITAGTTRITITLTMVTGAITARIITRPISGGIIPRGRIGTVRIGAAIPITPDITPIIMEADIIIPRIRAKTIPFITAVRPRPGAVRRAWATALTTTRTAREGSRERATAVRRRATTRLLHGRGDPSVRLRGQPEARLLRPRPPVRGVPWNLSAVRRTIPIQAAQAALRVRGVVRVPSLRAAATRLRPVLRADREVVLPAPRPIPGSAERFRIRQIAAHRAVRFQADRGVVPRT